MSFDRITNNEDQKTAGVTMITGDAVDMDLLNAFEELQSDDGSDLIVELIDLYLEDAPQRIASMREASLATEWLLLKRAAHNLKGSSGNLGVRQVALTCEEIETIDHSSVHSSSGVERILQRLDDEFAAANEVLVAERSRRLR